MQILHWVAVILLIVGGLNWGLVGLWDYNLVAELFGSMPTIERTVYVLVGVSAIWRVYDVFMMRS